MSKQHPTTKRKNVTNMTTLVILQLVCCTVTGLLALHLALASLQVRWKARRYEVSRWLLCLAMSLLSIHYLVQITHGLRAQGSDVGAVFNILFYTPISFVIALSIINIESSIRMVFRYCLHIALVYVLILTIFVFGVISNRSMHLGNLLYIMLALFVSTMVYSIFVIHKTKAKRIKKLFEESAVDLQPYVCYSRTSITLLYLSTLLMPIAILYNIVLIIVGPLMLLTIVFFVYTFIPLGFYITPREKMVTDHDEQLINDLVNIEQGNIEDNVTSYLLTNERQKEIEGALRKWCEEKEYKDSNMTLLSLATRLGYQKKELMAYFNQSEHTNFRTWLNDIRFNEAIRMMENFPNYSNDAISCECGFSSHTQIYRIFKQKTGLSPKQWRERLEIS